MSAADGGLAASPLEIGLVDEEWLHDPGEGPIFSSAPCSAPTTPVRLCEVRSVPAPGPALEA